MVSPMEHEPHGTHQTKKATASGWIGSALEYYDFFIYATAASLICPHGPPEFPVVAGRNPFVHVAPPSIEVAHPMFDDPPSWNRPVWNAETIVFPAANVSGSTCVAW